ncbi:hypothetical protein M9H77_14178 [Catharanthus roseus]|uniref:Uncharacterized protein n=1 Tax=Catharanthus roseus TaxID=4058 RepID=A0ACC0BMH4_CATRO|nr:hypothetical protein M9H77_14178 [Catharanthus roseus]
MCLEAFTNMPSGLIHPFRLTEEHFGLPFLSAILYTLKVGSFLGKAEEAHMGIAQLVLDCKVGTKVQGSNAGSGNVRILTSPICGWFLVCTGSWPPICSVAELP